MPLDPARYREVERRKLGHGYSMGLYIDSTTDTLAVEVNGAVVERLSASGSSVDLSFANEARGDLIRRETSDWARLAAKTAGQVVAGDGTDVRSLPIGGDVAATYSADTLALTVSDLTITNEARGDILRRGATAWERLAAKTAGQLLIGDGNDLASVAMSGDITITGAGVTSIGAAKVLSAMMAGNLVRVATGSITAADIVSTDAGKLGHAQGYPLLAAVGAHNVPEFISATLIYDYATAAYTDGGNLTVNLSGGGVAQSDLVAAVNFCGAAADKVVLLRPPTATAGVAMVENAGLNLVAAAAFTNPGTAAGVIRYAVMYRVHATGL